MRSSNPTGNPKGKYCANLGHRQDDESGLTYMRARYYEPDSGRFVNSDPARKGNHWFAYCGNDPVNRIDRSGEDWTMQDSYDLALVGLGILTSSMAMTMFIATLSFFAWSCCVPVVGLPIGWYKLVEGMEAAAEIFQEANKANGLLGKLEGAKFRAGGLVEVLGMAAAYGAMLDFMFRHTEDGVVNN